ncbi:MAG: TonB C-terminal domain-containing protein [Blastocatellia bacterium]|nr:TonB C-terminal domain-containing protein [Blastocatellia bacterium]
MSFDQRSGAIFSLVLHVALVAACVWVFRNPISTMIVAAGEGQGSGESVIEVGTIEAGQLGLTTPRSISTVGEDANPANNLIVERELPKPETDAEVLPSDKQTPKLKEKLKTNRPTANQNEQFVTKDPLRGSSADRNVEVGRTFGSQTPAMTHGVGVGMGTSLGANGVPGGSAYGRIIQGILSGNYNPQTLNDVVGTQYVIVQIHIASSGRITSVVGGRVVPAHFKRRSSNDLINAAVERAIIASANSLPPIPNGFLMGAQEAVAEVWFRYPK